MKFAIKILLLSSYYLFNQILVLDFLLIYLSLNFIFSFCLEIDAVIFAYREKNKNK